MLQVSVTPVFLIKLFVALSSPIFCYGHERDPTFLYHFASILKLRKERRKKGGERRGPKICQECINTEIWATLLIQNIFPRPRSKPSMLWSCSLLDLALTIPPRPFMLDTLHTFLIGLLCVASTLAQTTFGTSQKQVWFHQLQSILSTIIQAAVA
jgi:hypothetical protein